MPIYRQLATMLLGFAIVAIAGDAYASIIVSGAEVFQLHLEPVGHAGAGAASAGEDHPVGRSADEQCSEVHWLLQVISAGAHLGLASSGGMTGSSSGPTGSLGASVATALDSVAAVVCSDRDPSGWVSGERCLMIPLAPSNSLLRPPQGV